MENEGILDGKVTISDLISIRSSLIIRLDQISTAPDTEVVTKEHEPTVLFSSYNRDELLDKINLINDKIEMITKTIT